MTIKNTLVPKDVIDALWRGDTRQARELAKKYQAELSARIGQVSGELQALEEQLRALEEMSSGGITAVPPARSLPGKKKSKASPSNKMTDEERGRRAKLIIDHAIALTARSGKPVNVLALAEELQHAKADLNVRPGSIRALLANVLYRSSQFERVGEGVYRLVAKTVSAKKGAAPKKRIGGKKKTR